MPSSSAIALFCLASIALAVVPGPAVTYIVTQSVDQGRRAGLASALGIGSGGLVHVAAATVGLSALIAASATAFTVIKLGGAAYLIGVGLHRILRREEAVETSTGRAPRRLRQLYLQGVVVNVLNPKTALFFVAFVPQFVSPNRGSVPLQVGLLGLLFSAIAFSSDVLYALLADIVGRKLRRGGTGDRLRRWASGGIFVVLGVVAATAQRSS